MPWKVSIFHTALPIDQFWNLKKQPKMNNWIVKKCFGKGYHRSWCTLQFPSLLFSAFSAQSSLSFFCKIFVFFSAGSAMLCLYITFSVAQYFCATWLVGFLGSAISFLLFSVCVQLVCLCKKNSQLFSIVDYQLFVGFLAENSNIHQVCLL